MKNRAIYVLVTLCLIVVWAEGAQACLGWFCRKPRFIPPPPPQIIVPPPVIPPPDPPEVYSLPPCTQEYPVCKVGIDEGQAESVQRQYKKKFDFLYEDYGIHDGKYHLWGEGEDNRFYNLAMEKGTFSYSSNPNAPPIHDWHFCIYSEKGVRSATGTAEADFALAYSRYLKQISISNSTETSHIAAALKHSPFSRFKVESDLPSDAQAQEGLAHLQGVSVTPPASHF